MKRKAYKFLIITAAMVFGLVGCSTEAKVERQLELGASSMEAGDYDKAIEAYEEVVSLDKYEIEGYKGLVIAMDADERGNEEIIQVVKDATEAISEIKESEEGLSEEDEEAAKDLYVVAVEAVDSNTDDQVTVLENAVEVIGEDGMLPDDFKGMLENALADNVLNGMDTTLAYVEMLEKLLFEENDMYENKLVEGELIATDGGYYICIGDNEDYPGIMSDYEFLKGSTAFRITLPNDISPNNESVYLFIQGHLIQIRNPMVKYINIEIINESFVSSSDSYSKAQETYLQNGLLLEKQNNEKYWLVRGVHDDNITESMLYRGKESESDHMKYRIEYKDFVNPEANDISEYIMKSFQPITAENSIILNHENYVSEQKPTGTGVPIQLEFDPTRPVEPVTGSIPNL